MDARPSRRAGQRASARALDAAITASANPRQAMTAQMIAAAVLALLGLMWAVPPPLAAWPRRAALTRPNSQLRGLRTFLTEEMKMRTKQTAPTDIDEYIAGFPNDVQEILEKIRRTIRKAAPDAEETIKYQMPTFTLNGNLVHFAAFKKHIGFYPAPRGIETFEDELSVYEGAKSSVRFPLDKSIPFDLISKIVKFRVQKNLERAEAKRKKR